MVIGDLVGQERRYRKSVVLLGEFNLGEDQASVFTMELVHFADKAVGEGHEPARFIDQSCAAERKESLRLGGGNRLLPLKASDMPWFGSSFDRDVGVFTVSTDANGGFIGDGKIALGDTLMTGSERLIGVIRYQKFTLYFAIIGVAHGVGR